jgi:NAD+ diphosphatase
MVSFNPALRPADDASGHRYIHVIGSAVFVDDRPADRRWGVHFLGMLGDEACWGVDVPHGDDPSDGAATDLFSYFGRASETEWMVAGRAVQLVEWARTHRFCGRCGTPTEPQAHERAMKCPVCGLLAFPRLAPAMITLVTRGEPGPDQQALLARGVQFRAPLYSCLAGFVEPGESLEEAVTREVFEEVGLRVRNPRYWGSQPWPFPHSLMVGFTAEWESGEIVCDPTEIVDAQWYQRDELPPIPPPISIARKLIDAWLTSP